MCGIAGIVNVRSGPPPARAALERMLGALVHRGPDEFGLFRDAHVGLAHTRLSIVDLASGQQPMVHPATDRWLVFNGEIFNFVELRAELQARGCEFRTRSDTEVILHAWDQWGQGAFDRFNGQWAIALWDGRHRQLILARDRVGVRPLYWAEHAGQVIFASEIKALFAACPDLPRAFDPDGLAQAFTLWSPVAPTTAFAGVHELPPGTVRVFDDVGTDACRAQTSVVWRPSFDETFRGSLADARDAVAAALTRATELRMLRADVDVGAYLSGGLDSSLIAHLGRQAKGDGFQTFSLRFADAEYDEGGFQRLMQARLGTTHHEIVVERQDIAAAFPEVVRLAERPILRTAPAPMFLLSKLVRQHGIKVVLTGEGADEMFAGYDLFREAEVRRFWARAPGSTQRPRLLDRLYPYLARSPVAQRAMAMQFFGQDLARWREPGFGHETRWRTTRALQRLMTPNIRAAGDQVVPRLLASLPAEFAGWRSLAQDQYLEIQTLMSGYLLSAQGDRMLMGNSVEGRFPFLDREVMALAGSLPASYKLRGLDEKHVLKQVATGLLPPEIVRRPKQPYRAPDALAFVPGTAWAEELMSDEVARQVGVFEPAAVTGLWRKCQARAATQFSNTDNMALIGMLSTHLLWRQFVAQAPTPTPVGPIRTLIDRLA